MASKRHFGYSNLVLANLKGSRDFIIGYVIANHPYVPNLGSMSHPHGLEDALVEHQPGPDHLGVVG